MRCGKGCNSDIELQGLGRLYEQQKKRYGGYVCSKCILNLKT